MHDILCMSSASWPHFLKIMATSVRGLARALRLGQTESVVHVEGVDADNFRNLIANLARYKVWSCVFFARVAPPADRSCPRARTL